MKKITAIIAALAIALVVVACQKQEAPKQEEQSAMTSTVTSTATTTAPATPAAMPEKK